VEVVEGGLASQKAGRTSSHAAGCPSSAAGAGAPQITGTQNAVGRLD
jgi:hypothetical protein